jgi:hypothetical protein
MLCNEIRPEHRVSNIDRPLMTTRRLPPPFFAGPSPQLIFITSHLERTLHLLTAAGSRMAVRMALIDIASLAW